MKVSSFEIMDMPGTNTLAFQIEEEQDVAALVKLEYTPHIVEGKSRKEFSVLGNSKSQDIVLLTLAETKAILSVGELKEGNLVPKESEISLSYGTVYNTEGVTYKEFAYTANLKRRFVIVDTSTGEEVRPTVFVDNVTNEIKGKCKLLPLRPYVVIETKIPKERKNAISENASVQVYDGKKLETVSYGTLEFEKSKGDLDIQIDDSIV